jgi:glycine dehydrogenase subunit 1
MSYVPNTNEELNEMLQKIGVSDFEDLLKDIPSQARVANLDMPDALSEFETTKLLESLAKKNFTSSNYVNFMGGGIYDHFIPTLVNSVLERPEFKTAYTPYQAEVSQGTLQVMYEFQTLICRLTGMDVANASLYDAATGFAEACLMAFASNKKSEFLIAGSINPFYLETAKTITAGRNLIFKTFVAPDGTADLVALKNAINENTSGVIVQHPNFLGNLEDVFEIEKIAHSVNALYISIFNPISLGLLTPPGKYNADIAFGEGQPLGIPMSFGGPILGLFTCKQELIRVMPGRLAGMTIDSNNQRAFVLTLQTREQQIKREKATSNICTNQGLIMLAATTYLETMGKSGIQDVAHHSFQKAHYLASKISDLKGYSLFNNKPFFNEFLINTPVSPNIIFDQGVKEGFFAGVDVSKHTDFKGLLVAVTEKRTIEELDSFVTFLAQFS